MRGQSVLDTLFVKLDHPAKDIHIEGLPENVVPLMKIKKSVNCTFANGISVPVRRSQVHVLPNFAMTVYSSQGKTRPTNVMILNSCRDHLSYYTALSRSSTAEGTVIIQGFNPSKITCGAHGSLLLFAIKMVMRPFWAKIKNLRTRYCAPYKFVSFGPTNTIVSDLERYDIGLPEYVKM